MKLRLIRWLSAACAAIGLSLALATPAAARSI